MLLVAALAAGCTGSNVGDPCTPESVPPDGFQLGEAYVETSSVQCRTRVCLVESAFEGNPNKIIGVDPECDGAMVPEECVTEQDVDDHIFCSCRCDTPANTNQPTCNCPSGFICQELVTVQGAGTGVQGSYCVRDPDA